ITSRHTKAISTFRSRTTTIKRKQVTVYRFTSGIRLSRLASTTLLCVVPGLIIAVATPMPAQSPPEHLSSASEKTTGADSTTGKDPLANPISTSDHADSTKYNAEVTDTLFGNSYKYDFANLNFNKNPMAFNFYNTTSLSAVGIWQPSRSSLVAGGVFD